MFNYQRERDTFIRTLADGTFRMRDSAQRWHQRAESFGSAKGYLIFARRMELCLRAALGVPVVGREGLSSLARDYLSAPARFESVRSQLRTDLSILLRKSSMVDCGAGTGALLGFIEWARLPYPDQLILLEPNPQYFDFLRARIEGKVNTHTRDRLSVITKELHHTPIHHVIYLVQDQHTGNQSQIQIMRATAGHKSLPAAARASAIMFVGVSKYYHPNEFRALVTNVQSVFQPERGVTVFNAQGTQDALPNRVSRMERVAYYLVKIALQLEVSGKIIFHNSFSRSDINSLPGKAHIIHNYGNAIVVALQRP